MGMQDNQLDKMSLEHCVVTPAQKKECKRQHKRKKRRQSNNVDGDTLNIIVMVVGLLKIY